MEKNKSNNFEDKSNKQIEEMAEIIARANGNEQDAAYYRPDATDLYNAGYRKSTEVAEEIFGEIEKEIELALDSKYKVKRDAQDMNDGLVNYVDGKIACLRGLLGFLAELKKKYTESEKDNG